MDSKFIKKMNEDYKKLLLEQDKSNFPLKTQKQELNKNMLEKNFTMKGKPFPTFLKPLFVDARMKNYLINTTKTIMTCVEKVSDLYFESQEYEKYFEMDRLDKELALIHPRYKRKVIMGRLDAFLYEDGRLSFLEFNCDSPSGMGWHDQLIGMMDALPVFKEMDKRFKAWREPLLPPFYRMLCNKYREFSSRTDKSTFAIVCNNESTIKYDVDLIIDYINNVEGHRAVFADPRDFDYDGKALLLHGEPIGLVYRDAIQDFTDYLKDVEPILNAYKDGKFCLINPFRSRVGGLKAVLWFMTDSRVEHLFTPEEKRIIHETIPWTRYMHQGYTNFKDKKIDLFPFVADNKDLFVLKPNAGYGGFGVTIGRETEKKIWDQVMERTTNESWVVQEFMTIPKEEYVDFTPEINFNNKNVNINFFAFDGEFGGGFVRISDSSIINIHQGGGLVPICYVEP